MDLAVDVDEAEAAFAGLALDDDVLVVGESEAVICWMRTSAWREILNVDVWVIKKRVSMCLLILEKWALASVACRMGGKKKIIWGARNSRKIAQLL